MIPLGSGTGVTTYTVSSQGTYSFVNYNGSQWYMVGTNGADHLVDVLSTANGGTGLSTIGTQGQALVVNGTATGLTYSTIGAQGSQGATGAQGSQGYQGFQGTTGSQGFQGTQGNNGAQGTQGFQGPQGYQGLTGTNGILSPSGDLTGATDTAALQAVLNAAIPTTVATTTGTCSGASKFITLASGTGVQVGQVVSGGTIPAISTTVPATVVTAISGGYITISNYTTGTMTAQTLTFKDGSASLLLAPGHFYVNQLTVYSNTRIFGSGKQVTKLHLAAGSNSDLIQSYGFGSLTGTGSAGGVFAIKIADLEIDGNYYAQSPQTTATLAAFATTINGAGMTGASGTLTVATALGAPNQGQVSVPGSGGTLVFAYTGVTSTTFTGCTLVTGTAGWTISNGAAVTLVQANAGATKLYLSSTTGFSGSGGNAYFFNPNGCLSGALGLQQNVAYSTKGSDAGGAYLTCTATTAAIAVGYLAYAQGCGVRIYGCNVTMTDVWIHGCVADGNYGEWSTSANNLGGGSMESKFTNCLYSSNGVNGHNIQGPHDSISTNCVSAGNVLAGWFTGTNHNFVACHGWGVPQVYSFAIGSGGSTFVGCTAEVTSMAGSCGLYVGPISNVSWKGGQFLGVATSGVTGYVGVWLQGASLCDIDATFTNCVAYAGSDGGNNRLAGTWSAIPNGLAVTNSSAMMVAAGSNGVAANSFSNTTLYVTDASKLSPTAGNTYLLVMTSTGLAVLKFNTTGTAQTASIANVNYVTGATGNLLTGSPVFLGYDFNGVIGHWLGSLSGTSTVQINAAGPSNRAAGSIDTNRGYTTQVFANACVPSATINTYGNSRIIQAQTKSGALNDYGFRFDYLRLTSSGIGAAEIITIRVDTTFTNGGTGSYTIPTTLTVASPSYTLSADDIYNCVGSGALKYYLVYVKSSISSSAATVTPTGLLWS